MSAPAVGQPAPDFALPATGGRTIRLSDLRGRNVVVYFYPKDDTPGCTAEGQGFRDHAGMFERANTVVLGISRDDLERHERFRDKYGFGFDLLSDTEEVACKAYDVIREKSMFGKASRGIERSTFLIDADGILRREWRRVKVPGHVSEVLEAARAL
jgi:peroxiredoxin Q/BCP